MIYNFTITNVSNNEVAYDSSKDMSYIPRDNPMSTQEKAQNVLEIVGWKNTEYEIKLIPIEEPKNSKGVDYLSIFDEDY